MFQSRASDSHFVLHVASTALQGEKRLIDIFRHECVRRTTRAFHGKRARCLVKAVECVQRDGLPVHVGEGIRI